ncbi:phage holin family protein [Aequorivita xiaoshiensis]|uniref:Phage holin family protein n=1 Tax=Aequorivita xiaoshiensis TaxID=2874476 RepID=A0A9X1R0A6_9FLAO|nr:phage holin family protein [Aequorivita xiaoshiensis]MCG2429949.1 phage holin family protein [Aequorivita xiaoshiensis]
MFKELTDSLNKITDKVEDYGLSTAEYYKLRVFKSVMKGSISLVNLLVFGSLFLFVLVFLSIGAAFWLGTFFEHVYVGFLLIGAFYALLFLLMFIFGKKIIEEKMLYKFSGILYDEDDIEPKAKAVQEVDEYQDILRNDTRAEERLKEMNL